MSEKQISMPNVKLGGKIVKEKGRTNGELGKDQDINTGKSNKKQWPKRGKTMTNRNDNRERKNKYPNNKKQENASGIRSEITQKDMKK